MTTDEERFVRILQRLGDPTASGDLCAVATEVVGVSGAGVMLMSGDVAVGRACSSDRVSTAIEDLQFSLGEGPCVDAYFQARPVLEPNLASPEVTRWPAFTPAAVEAGARAVFGFPLQLGPVCLGALNLYCSEAGALSEDQHADAIVTADVLTRRLLDLQRDAHPGSVAEAIEASGDFHLVVHQASGMVAVQLDVSVAEALIRLRAHGFANDRQLSDVAHDVVARRLRFDAGTGEPVADP